MSDRAFPVVYASDVAATAAFYRRFGFQEHFRQPPEGDAGYIGLRRGASELAIVTVESPKQLIGARVGTEPRFELFVYVEGVDRIVDELRGGGATVFRKPQDMPWGERVAWVADPEGNPVALAEAPTKG